jgi:hypothetical protein
LEAKGWLMTNKALILPAGTSHTELVNLPLCGGWLGSIRVGISVAVADATIHEWLFIAPNLVGNKTGFRRTAMSAANNYYNSTLRKEQHEYRWLAQKEALMRITYTSANPIGVLYETNRAVQPGIYPELTQPVWNIANSTPWTGANTAGSNATEKAVGTAGQLNGLVYWKVTT